MISIRSFFKTEIGKIVAFVATVLVLSCTIALLSKSTKEGMDNPSTDPPINADIKELQNNMRNLFQNQQTANTSSGNEAKTGNNDNVELPNKEETPPVVPPSQEMPSQPSEPQGAPAKSDSTEQCYVLQECSYTDGVVDTSNCKIVKTCIQPSKGEGIKTAKKCMISSAEAEIDPSMCWISNVSEMPKGIGAEYI